MSFFKILSYLLYLLQYGELVVIIDDKLIGKFRRDFIIGFFRNYYLGNFDVLLQVYYEGVIFFFGILIQVFLLCRKKFFVFKQCLVLFIINMCIVLMLDEWIVDICIKEEQFFVFSFELDLFFFFVICNVF